MKDERVYLRHILDCIQEIEKFTEEGRAAFFSDAKTQAAVLRNQQVLAESTYRLSPDSKSRHLEIDWTGIAGTRNILVHDYLGINLASVWSVLEKDLPPLKTAVQDLLKVYEQ